MLTNLADCIPTMARARKAATLLFPAYAGVIPHA